MMHYESRVDRLASFLIKKVNKAVYEFGMIEDGDRIAIGLSGGKDSFSLLRLLDYRRRSVPEKYELIALHVIGDARGPDMPPYPELENWLILQKIDYAIRPTHLAEKEILPMSCRRCTWNRRRTLFEMAKDHGCNKLALGHHLDDLAETVLLNLAHHGKLETIDPLRSFFDGAITIIRPLAFVPEKDIVTFASANNFPSPPPECPISRHSERKLMKSLLAEMQKAFRQTKINLVRAALKNK